MKVRTDHHSPWTIRQSGQYRLLPFILAGMLLAACAEPPGDRAEPSAPRTETSPPTASAPAMRIHIDPESGVLVPPPDTDTAEKDPDDASTGHENVRESLYEPVTWPDGTMSVRPEPSSVPYHGLKTCTDGSIAEECPPGARDSDGNPR